MNHYSCYNIPTANELRDSQNVHSKLVSNMIHMLKMQMNNTPDPKYHRIPISIETYNSIKDCMIAKGYTFMYTPDMSGNYSYHLCA